VVIKLFTVILSTFGAGSFAFTADFTHAKSVFTPCTVPFSSIYMSSINNPSWFKSFRVLSACTLIMDIDPINKTMDLIFY
jgi:hypothetical protein